jgi:hypothetical protein
MIGGEQPPADPNAAIPAPAPAAPAPVAPAPAAPADPNALPPPEQAEEIEPGMDQGSKKVKEYVNSLFDKNVGKFPRGETLVKSGVQKKFGPNAVNIADEEIKNLETGHKKELMRMRKLAGV